jgi:hypothetical protein
VVGIETGAEFVLLVVGRAVVGQEVALVSGLQVESEGLRGTQKGCFLLRDIHSYYEDLYVDVDRRYRDNWVLQVIHCQGKDFKIDGLNRL